VKRFHGIAAWSTKKGTSNLLVPFCMLIVASKKMLMEPVSSHNE